MRQHLLQVKKVNYIWLRLMAGILFFLFGADPVTKADESQARPGSWSLSTDGSIFSLSAFESSLVDVVRGINESTPMQIDVDRLPDKIITVRYNNISLEQLLDRLGVSYVLKYQAGPGGETTLTDGWVGQFDQPPPIGQTTSPLAGAGIPVPGGFSSAVHRVFGGLTPEERAADNGVQMRTALGATMTMDGDLSDWAVELPWQKVSLGGSDGAVTDGRDASLEFVTAADQTSLYIAVKIADNEKALNKEEIHDAKNEDSLDLMIGEGLATIKRQNNLKYNQQGDLISSGRQHIYYNRNGFNRWSAIVVDNDDGWFLEAAIPLEEIGGEVQGGSRIPFNLRLNDDDDGGERDHVLTWSNTDELTGVLTTNSGSLFFVDLDNP